MTNRTVTVLAAALVVLGALALIAQYDPQPPSPGGDLLLPELPWISTDQRSRSWCRRGTRRHLSRGGTGLSARRRTATPLT